MRIAAFLREPKLTSGRLATFGVGMPSCGFAGLRHLHHHLTDSRNFLFCIIIFIYLLVIFVYWFFRISSCIVYIYIYNSRLKKQTNNYYVEQVQNHSMGMYHAKNRGNKVIPLRMIVLVSIVLLKGLSCFHDFSHGIYILASYPGQEARYIPSLHPH